MHYNNRAADRISIIYIYIYIYIYIVIRKFTGWNVGGQVMQSIPL